MIANMIVTKTVFGRPLSECTEVTPELQQLSIANYERRSLMAEKIGGSLYQNLSWGWSTSVDLDNSIRLDTRYRMWPDLEAAEKWIEYVLQEGAVSCEVVTEYPSPNET